VTIEPPFYCDYGEHISIAENFFMNFGGIILDCNVVRIGANVQCGPSVQLLAATHPLAAAERIIGPELSAPITIGDNVWLGGGVIVCPGVTIGANTTIGAGSVVTRDIPANVFAAGNPCRVIRTLE
jgi:maltose O-acetyltransferase